MDGVHPHDIGTILDAEGIAVRTGSPLCPAVDGPVRSTGHGSGISGFLNTKEEIDVLVKGIDRVIEVFS